MSTVNLRFVEGGGWDSKVIRWDTRCRWSHVEVFFGQSTIGAMLDGGVKQRSLDDPDYRNAVAYDMWQVTAPDEQIDAFETFLHQQIGKPYDWRAIASFGLGSRDWREPDSWFCSELVARCLEVAVLLRLPQTHESRALLRATSGSWSRAPSRYDEDDDW